MATTSTVIGKVSVTPKGTWSNVTAYDKLDVVSSGGSSYVAKQDVPAGTALTDTTYWQMIAQKGETGDVSLDGVQTLTNKTIAFADNTLTGVASTSTSQTLTNKTIDANSNTLKNVVTSKNITNCITEIPQDITITISGSNAVVKSGSKIYYPDGFDGTTPKFSSLTLDTDKTLYSPTTNGKWFIAYSLGTNGITARRNNRTASGTTTPTTDYWLYYNTDDNKVYDVNNTTGVQATFPIAIVTVENNAITSIDQVFNGMGYIGSTLFVLPGLKALYPALRNPDGTLRSGEIIITSVTTKNCSSTGNRSLWIAYNTAIYDASVDANYYDEDKNIFLDSGNNTPNWLLPVANYTTTSGVVSNFKPKTAFHAVDYNDWQRHIGSGEVHDITSSLTSNFETLGGSGQGLFWCVINRVCYVTINAIRNIASTSATTTVAAGLPKAKMQVYSSWFNGATGSALVFVSVSGTELRMGSNPNAASNCFVSFSYPVADDWVES